MADDLEKKSQKNDKIKKDEKPLKASSNKLEAKATSLTKTKDSK